MLITIASFTEPWEAHIFRGRLEAEGVPAWVAHDQHVTLDWPMATALGGVKVQVPPAFVEEARAVEQHYLNADYQANLLEEQPDITDIRCPECHSSRYRSPASAVMTILAVLTLGLASIIFPPTGNRRICSQCGHQWEGE